MINKHPGTCSQCGQMVLQGDGQLEMVESGWKLRHADCVINHLFHVYECEDCVLTFAVEQTKDLLSIACPVCQSDESISDVASGEMKIIPPAPTGEKRKK